MNPTKEQLSPLAAALKARKRKAYEFDVAPFVGFDGEQHKVAIRVPTKREQDLALAQAHDYCARHGEKAAADPDLLIDAKCAYIVAEAVRDPAAPDKGRVFPTGEWATEHLSAEQIGALVNLVNEVRRKENPNAWSIGEEDVENVVGLCAAAAGFEIPEAVLADRPREYLSHLVVLLSLKLAEERLTREATADTQPAPEVKA